VAIQLPSVKPSLCHPWISQALKLLRHQVRAIRSFNCAQFGSHIAEPGGPAILSLLTLIIENLGTPVDCVSLALSGRLFPWSSPVLVP
jgi:hypothetical protein